MISKELKCNRWCRCRPVGESFSDLSEVLIEVRRKQILTSTEVKIKAPTEVRAPTATKAYVSKLTLKQSALTYLNTRACTHTHADAHSHTQSHVREHTQTQTQVRTHGHSPKAAPTSIVIG